MFACALVLTSTNFRQHLLITNAFIIFDEAVCVYAFPLISLRLDFPEAISTPYLQPNLVTSPIKGIFEKI